MQLFLELCGSSVLKVSQDIELMNPKLSFLEENIQELDSDCTIESKVELLATALNCPYHVHFQVNSAGKQAECGLA